MGICSSEQKKDYDPNLYRLQTNTEQIENIDDLNVNFFRKNKKEISEEYDVDEKIMGKGGYGEVHKAVHRASGETRVVKIMQIGECSEEGVRKMVHEARLLKKLDHPNIVKVYEWFQDERHIHLIFEFIEGKELFQLVKEN